MSDQSRSPARRPESETSQIEEVAEFAKYLTLLFKELQISQRQYAARVLADETLISRYLNGRRVATQDFLDRLIKEVDRHRKAPVQVEAVNHLRKLRLSALRVVDPHAFEMENLRDQVETSHKEIRRLLQHQEALTDLLEKRQRQVEEAERKSAELEAEWISERIDIRSTELQLRSERDELNDECERLKAEIISLREKLDAVRDLRQSAEDRCEQLEERLTVAELALSERQADLLGDIIEVPDLEQLKIEVVRARREARMSEVAQKLVLASAWYPITDLLTLAKWLQQMKQSTLARLVLSDAVRFRSLDYLVDLMEAVIVDHQLRPEFSTVIASSIGALHTQTDVFTLYRSLRKKWNLFGAVYEMTSAWALSSSPEEAAKLIILARKNGDDWLAVPLLFDIGAVSPRFAAEVSRNLVEDLPDDALVITSRSIVYNPSPEGPESLFMNFISELSRHSRADVRLFQMAQSRLTSPQLRRALRWHPLSDKLAKEWLTLRAYMREAGV